ncbi:MAG: SpoIIE family protein phosphatase [Clostridia bacterium]|nr:SpoIIE family protein phosphatase [Clostridia bacterium]
MNDLFADISYKSINHVDEQLCGDHVELVCRPDSSQVIVLADGLGSGVKASILSTLTSKIIATMIAEGLPLEECVSAIAEALPVCSVRGVAYSTFTIIHLLDSHTAELIQYDNPMAILIRNGRVSDYPATEINIDGKRILKSRVRLQEGDVLIAMSDGCPHAGIGKAFNFGWKREDIAAFMADMSLAGHTAKALCALLIDECDKLYGHKPGDDATACVVRMRRRTPMSILFGPPASRDDSDRMMRLFFSREGKHIICGGTTASIAAKWLGKPVDAAVRIDLRSDVPPISRIEGVDLVTEGVVTMSRVLSIAQDYLMGKDDYMQWGYGRDGATKICQLLFEEATDINFFVGKAVNPAHQGAGVPINFNVKMNLVEQLVQCLRQMDKRVKVSYF